MIYFFFGENPEDNIFSEPTLVDNSVKFLNLLSRMEDILYKTLL